MLVNRTVEFKSEHEIAKLIALIDDGVEILRHHERQTRDMDGYSLENLIHWRKCLGQLTDKRVKILPLSSIPHKRKEQ